MAISAGRSIPYPIGLCSVSGNFNLKPKKTVTRGHINKILGYNIGLWSQFDSNNAEEFLARDLSKSSKKIKTTAERYYLTMRAMEDVKADARLESRIVDDDTETYESIVERFKHILDDKENPALSFLPSRLFFQMMASLLEAILLVIDILHKQKNPVSLSGILILAKYLQSQAHQSLHPFKERFDKQVKSFITRNNFMNLYLNDDNNLHELQHFSNSVKTMLHSHCKFFPQQTSKATCYRTGKLFQVCML